MFENIRLSFQGIWSHKMRSFLTMLGIIIGIAAIIAIVSTIKGTNEQIKENLIGSGENTVEVSLYQGEWEYEMDYNGVPQGVPLVTDDVMSDIKDLDHVVNASAYLSRQDYSGVYHLNTAFSGGYVRGIDNSYFDTCNYIMKEGRAFTDEDFKKYKKVAILDTDSANALFQGEDSVGNTIEIQKEPYTVIGIVTKAKVFEPVINSIDDYYTYAQDTAGSIYIPNTTWPIIYQYDEPQNVVIRVDSTDNMTSAGKACADVLNNYLSPKDDTIQYKAKDLLEQAQQIQELSSSTNTMLIWIAGISLIVGGIGVMNIMLVSVTERTREIGIRKALGARTKDILTQFLIEAAMISAAGGLIGTFLGISVVALGGMLFGITTVVKLQVIVIAVAFSAMVGLGFGLYPARKAAKADPVIALRYE